MLYESMPPRAQIAPQPGVFLGVRYSDVLEFEDEFDPKVLSQRRLLSALEGRVREALASMKRSIRAAPGCRCSSTLLAASPHDSTRLLIKLRLTRREIADDRG